MRYIGQWFIKNKNPNQESLLSNNSLQEELINHSVSDEKKNEENNDLEKIYERGENVNSLRLNPVFIEIKNPNQSFDRNEFDELLESAFEIKNSQELELLRANRILQFQILKKNKGCKLMGFLPPMGLMFAGVSALGLGILQCNKAVNLLMEPYMTNLYNFTGNFSDTCNSSFPISNVDCLSRNKFWDVANEILKQNGTVCADLINDVASSELFKYEPLLITGFVISVIAIVAPVGLLLKRICNWYDQGLSSADQAKINRLSEKYDIYIPANASYPEMLNLFRQKLSQLGERYNNLLLRKEVVNALYNEVNLVPGVINIIEDYAGISVNSEKAKARYAFTSETSSRLVYSFFTGLKEQSKLESRTAKSKEQIVSDIFQFAALK